MEHRKLKITELNRISTEEFKKAEKLPLVVVLDNIRSLHNIGSVFRTSDAFRVECIYLCGITVHRDSAIRHQTLAECIGYGRHCHLGLVQAAEAIRG